jgi:two-component system phosphate regulon sensor histidine kinase PhoR
MSDDKPGPSETENTLWRGLRPAASEDHVRTRTLDVVVVAAGGVGLIALAGLMGALEGSTALLMCGALLGLAALWLKYAPRASRTVRRVELPLTEPASVRAQFPLTPETGVAIIERLPDPIILLDRSGRIVLHNRAATNIVGEAAARRHISTVMRVPEVLEAVAQVVAGEAAQVVEYTQPVPIERHYHAFIAPVIAAADPSRDRLAAGPRDRQRNVLILLHDLTTIKRAEQMRADFVANASHELRTPLASMSGFVETLRGPARDDPEARDKFLAIMQEQAERMGRLINDLLSLSRIELNEHVRPVDHVDMAAIVNDTVDMLTPLAAKEGAEIIVDVETGLPLPLGDRDELVQVCQNLLANAIKYGGTGGKVEISLRRDRPGAHDTGTNDASGSDGESQSTSGAASDTLSERAGSGLPGSIVMSVRDWGPGIEREHIPRLTERFYRVDVEQSRRRGGTGLGLAIVKHIVSRHMGSLSIDSRIGAGSVFRVFLPVDPAAAQAGLLGSADTASDGAGDAAVTIRQHAPEKAATGRRIDAAQ